MDKIIIKLYYNIKPMSLCELSTFINEIYLSKNNKVDLNEMHILYKQWREKRSNNNDKKIMIENLKTLGCNIVDNQNEVDLNNLNSGLYGDKITSKNNTWDTGSNDENYLLSILNKQEQLISDITKEIETMKNHIIYINMKITDICNTFS